MRGYSIFGKLSIFNTKTSTLMFHTTILFLPRVLMGFSMIMPSTFNLGAIFWANYMSPNLKSGLN